MEKGKSLYGRYKAASSLLLDYQMCRAYFNDSSLDVMGVVDKILCEKHKRFDERRTIRKTLLGLRGVKNAFVEIPSIGVKALARDIIAKFVKKNFDNMVIDRQSNRSYPFKFRDIIDAYEREGNKVAVKPKSMSEIDLSYVRAEFAKKFKVVASK
jgi:hypothetical protein